MFSAKSEVSSAETVENYWSTKTPSPQATSGVRAAVVNGKIHVVAVIGDKHLCEILSEFKILVDHPINDYPSNSTRFVVIGRKHTQPTDNDTTSLVLSIEKDKPGGLYHILSEFAQRDINLTKITSRPTKEVLGEYLFYIDCEGHMLDNKIKEALEKELVKKNLNQEIQVVTTGCNGFCEKGPIVVVQPEGIFYQLLKVEDIPHLVEEHFLKGRPVQKLMFTPEKDELVIPKMMDIGFFSRQTLIALRNRGMIDPEVIAE